MFQTTNQCNNYGYGYQAYQLRSVEYVETCGMILQAVMSHGAMYCTIIMIQMYPIVS